MTAMRANRKPRTRHGDDAQVGIGTMIVFIATVLVAAIAAGVLIDTSGKLQERSSRTGNEATDQVSSNLAVQSILGRRYASGDAGLKELTFMLTLAPGAQDVDLSQLRIQIQNGSMLKTFNHSNSPTPGADQFNATEIRDADSSFTSANPVMSTGDLVNVTIVLASGVNNMEFQPREQITTIFVPEVGTKIQAGFRTPNSYATKLVLELR